ncbi:MAG: SAM-dependent DNA methyltransferase [Alphaproteobacteria bacterium]|nr:SAM-dependent DNA methyltransferase [Alphaproteobacteria bacterium]
MITGVIKNKIDKIWTDIWAGGITNPITVIEQLTYLMFIHDLDVKELETEQLENLTHTKMEKIFPQTPAGQALRWHNFKDKNAAEIFDTLKDKVFPFIKNDLGKDGQSAFSRYMSEALFLFPTPQIVEKVVTGLDDLYRHDLTGMDVQGDLYEYMLDKLATSGKNGQFRTPAQIRNMMVRLIEPTPDSKICDPACGTAGFLISSAEFIRSKYENVMTAEQWDHFAGDMFNGFDMDKTMLRISAMNLMLHSITKPTIEYKDSVSKTNDIAEEYDIILANPPFSGTIDKEGVSDDLKRICNTTKTELLFIALFLRMLKKGGRCACIVPDGVLFGTTNAHQALRKELIEKHRLQAVISMPSGVFKPYSGVSTAVLVFTKTGAGGTDKVWFYDMKADGFSLDDKRNPVKENDIPDILARFHDLEAEKDRKRTEQSFFVDKADIERNNYDLSINRYKEVVYEKIDYEKPDVILNRIDTLIADIAAQTKKVRKMLDE